VKHIGFDRRPWRLMATALVIGLLGAGCSEVPDDRTPEPTIRMVDALGDTVALPGRPHRVVSLAPSLTEMVYVLGQQDALIGVTDYCDYPPEALDKPRVSGFNIINHEAVVAKNADLALAVRGNPKSEIRKLRALGVPVFAFEVHALDDLVQAAATMGVLLGCPDAGDSVSASWARRVANVRSKVKDIPDDERLTVFFGGVDEPVYSVGQGSFIHDVIVTAGGHNIFGDIESPWPRVDLETVVARGPDVIVASGMVPSETDNIRSQLMDAPGWRSLAAVKAGRLVVLGDAIMRDGPRLIDALERLAREMYPSRFPDR
jgi:iron complex transport system substrate-binding protein